MGRPLPGEPHETWARGRLSLKFLSHLKTKTHECYTLDRSGNATDYYNGTSSTCQSGTTASFNASNEMSSWGGGSVGYLEAGELATKAAFSFEYDPWNRLMIVKNSGLTIETYRYNGLHQRTERATATPKTYYYYGAEGQVLDDINMDTGALINAYVWGTQYIDDLVVWYKGTTRNYMVSDANFNVVTRLTGAGGAFQVSDRTVYEGYGNPKLMNSSWSFISIGEDRYMFTGRQSPAPISGPRPGDQ